jgi:hypothetical protein
MHKLFPSQHEDEKIFIVVREHWVRFFFRLAIWLMFAAALLVFNRYAPDFLPGLFEDLAGDVTSLLRQVYTLFLAASLFLLWVFYYLNMQIVTDRRVVDVDQVGLFSHVVSELHIENIEDVTSETNGILGNIFNYGMVYIQTAGSKERFEFNNVPNPSAINKLVLDLYEKIPHKKQD